MNIYNIHIATIISLILLFIFTIIISWLEDLKGSSHQYRKNKILNSCYNGIISGGLIGIISGDLNNAFTNALIYGLVNPITLFIKIQYLLSEEDTKSVPLFEELS